MHVVHTSAPLDEIERRLRAGQPARQIAEQLHVGKTTVYRVRTERGVPRPDRFWSHVAVAAADECWLWTGELWPNGYGIFVLPRSGGRRIGAHRHSLQLALGHELAGEEMACHRCDNPPCCNPAHLFAGTKSDNTQDAIAKGRFTQMHRRALDDDQLRSVRQRIRKGEPLALIAPDFGVTVDVIQRVRRAMATGPHQLPRQHRMHKANR